MSNGGDLSEGVSRIAGLVIINAMIFQEVLSSHEARVEALTATRRRAAREGKSLTVAFSEQWDFIIRDIDYYPIFHIASELLSDLSSVGTVDASLAHLADRAQSITGRRAALRHDLMGRIFHRMLLEAKYLATYYTSIPAATMLLRTALRRDAWEMDWGDPAALLEFKIADLACGTGTLLMAAGEAIVDNALNAYRPSATPLQKYHSEVHRVLAEEVIHGYDVLPTAIHLTAATLAMRSPGVAFTKMNMFVMPLGGRTNRLGSLDFLQAKQLNFYDIFGAIPTSRIGAAGAETVTNAQLPPQNLIAINPPFNRSVGGNLLFGSIPEARRGRMQKRLKQVVKAENLKANITGGLGTVFVALAHRHLLPGGRLCLVLPKALLNGIAWTPTREVLMRHYNVDYIFSSHDPERWNFSESTDLSEVMVIARKRSEASDGAKTNTVYVNFLRNPTNIIEALNVSHSLQSITPGDLLTDQGSGAITLGTETVARVVSLPWSLLRTHDAFMWGTAFAQDDLTRVALRMWGGKLWIPGRASTCPLPMVQLNMLGRLGPDRRDIHDGFTHGTSRTAYPCVWGRDAIETKRLRVPSNGFLVPRARAKEGRHLRRASDLWPLASDILLPERIWLRTQSIMAARADKEVLANMWWTFRPRNPTDTASKALVLWLNSTLGLITLLANRLETRGAWISFKKPMLEKLRVFDVASATSQSLADLAAAYDRVSSKDITPFPNMAADPVRKEIDDAVSSALTLPDLSRLRTMLGSEPVVTVRRM
jgi:hypothetical protein